MRKFWLFFTVDANTGADAASGFMPTQNMVEMYEKKGTDGNYYPITDPRSGYNDQDPFVDRDPRFYNNIATPGTTWGLKNAKTFYWTTYQGGAEYNLLLTNPNSNQRNQTGYICNKYIYPEANDMTSDNNNLIYHVITCFIRYAQVYLDYAEASFEATGSATAIVPGCSMTAAEALNVVRNRVGVTNVAADIANDPVKFRETLRRERTVELMFENHRWFDIRRWMIMHTLFEKPNPLKGILATPTTSVVGLNETSPENANLKFSFKTIDLPAEIRGYTMKNYWYPFTINEVASMKNLVQNPGW